MARPKKKPILPKEIYVMPNADKKFQESWSHPSKKNNPMNLPHSFRMIIAGNCSRGKSNMCKNFILHQSPPFERIFVCHASDLASEDGSKEWQDCGGEYLPILPPPSHWEAGREEKRLLILDDICYEAMNKTQRAYLDRSMGFISSHCNLSIIITTQNFFSVQPSIRRLFNFYVVYRPDDLDSLNTIARRVGIKPEIFEKMFDELATGRYDCIMRDLTPDTPYPLRLNGFDVIEMKDDHKIKGE